MAPQRIEWWSTPTAFRHIFLSEGLRRFQATPSSAVSVIDVQSMLAEQSLRYCQAKAVNETARWLQREFGEAKRYVSVDALRLVLVGERTIAVRVTFVPAWLHMPFTSITDPFEIQLFLGKI